VRSTATEQFAELACTANEVLNSGEAVLKQRTQVLSTLLEQAMSREGWFLACRSEMGRAGSTQHDSGPPVPSFTVLHSIEWISQHIRLGSEMPFMENKIDHESGRLIVDRSNADEVKQRAPDWTRQAALAAYLAQPQRKFGPIMAVISPDWVEEPNHELWDAKGRAARTCVEFTPLEPSRQVGLLKLNGVRVYALDGQHRVLGMRGLREIRDLGFLQLRDRDGVARGNALQRDEFLRTCGLSLELLQSVFLDTMAVEYTPAVVGGETHAEATRRIRRTFIAINSYAKRTEKGENILLDETNGFAIAARRLAVNHPLFAPEGSRKRVNWKTTSIPSGRIPFITTLSTLQEIAEAYLPAACPKIVKPWRAALKGMVPVRPAEEALGAAFESLADVFDRISNLPVFARLKELGSDEELAYLEKWREFPRYTRTGELVDGTGRFRGHLLLRPLGQLILANALAELTKPKKEGGSGLTLNTIFRRLSQIDENGGFEAHRPKSVWWGVTYTPTTNRILNRNKSWGHRLLVQMVAGGLHKDAQLELWWDWVKARAVNLKAQTWKNLDGRVARFDWEVPELPETALR